MFQKLIARCVCFFIRLEQKRERRKAYMETYCQNPMVITVHVLRGRLQYTSGFVTENAFGKFDRYPLASKTPRYIQQISNFVNAFLKTFPLEGRYYRVKEWAYWEWAVCPRCKEKYHRPGSTKIPVCPKCEEAWYMEHAFIPNKVAIDEKRVKFRILSIEGGK